MENKQLNIGDIVYRKSIMMVLETKLLIVRVTPTLAFGKNMSGDSSFRYKLKRNISSNGTVQLVGSQKWDEPFRYIGNQFEKETENEI